MRKLSFLAVLFVVLAARADDRGMGSINGMVRLAGRPPEIAAIIPAFNTEVCGVDSLPVRSLLLGTNQTIANVIVHLGINAPASRPSGTQTQAVTATRCELLPRIQIISNGLPLLLRNDDPTLHILQVEMLSVTGAPALLQTAVLPYAGQEKVCPLDRLHEPRMLKIVGANGEDSAVAFAAVIPHDYCSLTDGQGRFTIRHIPPGNYKLFLWHEVLGTLTRDLRVTADRATAIDVEFPTPPNP